MRGKKGFIRLQTALTILAVALFMTNAWAASEKVIHNFSPGGVGGDSPHADLIVDAAGNLYGTTTAGGPYNCGNVFELIRGEGGRWAEKVLHNFNCNDGSEPLGALVMDAEGNLYGTTYFGGLPDGDYGHGVAFELMPNPDGSWAAKVLHYFGRRMDGANPYGGLTFDAAGNLYGTTEYNGGAGLQYGHGTVFELMPQGDGSWTEKVLHHFSFRRSGKNPTGNLIVDPAGHIYGMASAGGVNPCNNGQGCGTVFELTPRDDGSWTERTLHNFGRGKDGQGPFNISLTQDAAGNLYGGTYGGGVYGCGVLFEMSPRGDGSWIERTLHNFGHGSDGCRPAGRLAWDAAGNLYGATYYGYDSGTVFEISPNQDGSRTEQVLHHFSGPVDGSYPGAGLVSDADGNLYGTTDVGGQSGGGTVYEIKTQ